MNIQESLEKLVRGVPTEIEAYLREVGKQEHINETKADMHIHMLRLDGNNRPRVSDFANFLVTKVIDYCIPASEIRIAKEKDAKYNTSRYTVALYKKASNLFTDLKNSGEPGELALSVLMQAVLKMPQVLCKMVLKTNADVHYHGADGIYGKYDNDTKKYCLYWGESKLYSDINGALSDCFDSIMSFLIEEGATGTRKGRDMDLFRTCIDFDDPALENAILEYLDPDNVMYLSLEYRGVCLIGYNEDAYPTDYSLVEDEIFTAIRQKINDYKDRIRQRLKKRTPLDTFVIEIFLLPISNVEELREQFLSNL